MMWIFHNLLSLLMSVHALFLGFNLIPNGQRYNKHPCYSGVVHGPAALALLRAL